MNIYNKLISTIVVINLAALSMGCSEPKNNSMVFSGCYSTLKPNGPAQIKINVNSDDVTMQMRKSTSATGRVWDDPASLDLIPINDAEKYFDIDPNNVTSMIGRSDRFFVLGHVTDSYANINPLLDSQYLIYILNASNTVFKVDCDKIQPEIGSHSSVHSQTSIRNKNDIQESNISIEPAQQTEPQ